MEDFPDAATEDEDEFFDSLDCFPHGQSDQALSDSTTSDGSPNIRCCLLCFCKNSKDLKEESSKRGIRFFSCDFGEPRDSLNSVGESRSEESTITEINNDRVGESVDSTAELGDESSSLLVAIAAFVIKATGFQIGLFFSMIRFPFLILYRSYRHSINPFGVFKPFLDLLFGKMFKILNVISGMFLKEKILIEKLAMRCGWGLVWSIYVGIVLSTLFMSSLVFSGFVMKLLVVEPIQLKEALNFDYTKNSPVAYVPVSSCASVGYGKTCKESSEYEKSLKSQVIPLKHKLVATVLLTLPESEYNRHLGAFQVRVELLSSCGEILASLSRPCMLHFRSEPIRLVLTFLKIVPLLTGYSSESQTLRVKFRGFTEGDVPISCLRVLIEPRAEFRPGTGIPGIYDASLLLESELPLFRRILWYWKTTIFVWLSIWSFFMEVLLTLVCCRPLIVPRSAERERFASSVAGKDG